MIKKGNGKEKPVNITEKTIWNVVIALNAITILFKLFNVFYFKHTFGEEFNLTYLMLIIPVFLLFVVTAKKEEK